MSMSPPPDGALLSIQGRLWRVSHLADGKHLALFHFKKPRRFLRMDEPCPGTIVEELDEPIRDLQGQDHVGKGILLNYRADVPADVVKEIMRKELNLAGELPGMMFWECATKTFGRVQTRPVATIHGAAICIEIAPIPPVRHARCLNSKRGPQIYGLAEYIRGRCRVKPDRTELREFFCLLAVRLIDGCGTRWSQARIPAKYRAGVWESELHGKALEDRIAELRDRLRPALETYESPPLEYADEVQRIILDDRYGGPRNGMANCDRVRDRLRGRGVSPRLLSDALDYDELWRDVLYDPRLDQEGLRKAARLRRWNVWDRLGATDERREVVLEEILKEDPIWLGGQGHRHVEFMPAEWRLRVLEKVGVDDAIEIVRRRGPHDRELELLLARFPDDADGVCAVARMARSPELVLKAAKSHAICGRREGVAAILDNRNSPQEAIELARSWMAHATFEAEAPAEHDRVSLSEERC